MIAQFALRLLLGMGLTWAVLPRRQISSGFFRIQCLLALALCVLAGVTAGDLSPPGQRSGSRLSERGAGGSRNDAPKVDPAASISPRKPTVPKSGVVGVCLALAVCSFLGSIAWTLERRRGGTAFLFAILAGTAGLLLLVACSDFRVPPSIRMFRGASEMASAAILGSCVTGMLLGHWYLTAPTMSIAPLSRANAWFGATVLARLALSAWGLAVVADGVSGPTHGVWLALRWIAGLALPLVLCAMVWRILRYRNTQAATGVLFAAVVLVFLGELAGTLLSNEVGVPL